MIGLRWMRRLLMATGCCALAVVTLWAAAALYFDVRISWLRGPLNAGYLLALTAIWFRVKSHWLAAGFTALGFTVVLAWWSSLQTSNRLQWQQDAAVLRYA